MLCHRICNWLYLYICIHICTYMYTYTQALPPNIWGLGFKGSGLGRWYVCAHVGFPAQKIRQVWDILLDDGVMLERVFPQVLIERVESRKRIASFDHERKVMIERLFWSGEERVFRSWEESHDRKSLCSHDRLSNRKTLCSQDSFDPILDLSSSERVYTSEADRCTGLFSIWICMHVYIQNARYKAENRSLFRMSMAFVWCAFMTQSYETWLSYMRHDSWAWDMILSCVMSQYRVCPVKESCLI